MLPATFPPTSEEWMKLSATAICLPSAKIGFHSQMSGRCVERPRVESGSLAIPMSPSSQSSLIRVSSQAGRPAMTLTAVSVGAANTSPCGDAMQAPKSCVSLTKTVNAVRSVAAAISSTTALKRLRRISSMTGSVRSVLMPAPVPGRAGVSALR